LRFLVFTDGDYGLRILENIRLRGPPDWEVRHVRLPQGLPTLVEDPGRYLEGLKLGGRWGLIIFMAESPSAFSLLPSVMERGSSTSVIAPVDDYSWLPLGLERQIREELGEVEAIFPRTFCTLKPVGVGAIDEFAERFGAPQLVVEVEGGLITRVEVVRGAPCGSTWHMAEMLPGTRVEEAGKRAGTLVQTFPCLASRFVERLLGDAPIHLAGHIAQRAVEDALRA